jgi:hypothetical protein
MLGYSWREVLKLRPAMPLILLGFSLVPALWAHQVSQKRDIAVFRLSCYQWDVPESALGAVDEEIREAFINLGRFKVLGLAQRLEPGDLADFIDAVRKYREERVARPEEMQMGREFFTPADFERLAGSFIVVVPSVASYELEASGPGFQVMLKTSFTFINVEQDRCFAQVFVESQGLEASPELAGRRAMDGVAPRLACELRKIAEFQLKTGVLEVHGGEVILELGRDLGLKVGDEYLLVSSRVPDPGKTLASGTGLLVVKEVGEEVSVGRLVFASPRPREGEQLRELPLFGVQTTPYVHVVGGLFHPRGIKALAGLRQSVTRGFYAFRPIFGLEVPFITNILAAIPLNLYLGAEYVIRMGRLEVTPHASLGVGGAYIWYLGEGVSEDQKFAFTHIGGTAGVNVSYLFANKLLLLLEAGYLNWFSLVPAKYFFESDYLFPDYDGLYFGAGLTIKL